MIVGKYSRVAELGEGTDVAVVGDGDGMSCGTCSIFACDFFCMAEEVILKVIQGKLYSQR